MNISDLIPGPVKAFVNVVLDKAQALLEGETARAIGYGGGVVVFLVARYAQAIPDVSLDQAIVQVGAIELAIAALVEPIRHYVSSPATVARLTK